MLSSIQIQNFSIIEKTQLSFQNGFHVLSGETGAGKSFLLQAIAFALGSRFDVDCLRQGADEAEVTLVFVQLSHEVVNLARTMGLLGNDGDALPETLTLSRSLHRTGRSRGFCQGQSVPLKILQKWGDLLLHQVSQHAAQQLREENFLLALLDLFGRHQAVKARYDVALRDFSEARQAWAALQTRIVESRRQEDFLRFQLEELQKADVKNGELEELENKKQRMKNRVVLAQQAFQILQGLREGEEALSDRLGRLLGLSQKAASLDETLNPIHEELHLALEKIEQAADFFSDYQQGLEAEPEAYEIIENRLARIHDLQRKFQTDELGLVRQRDKLERDLSELADFDQISLEYQQRLERVRLVLLQEAQLLSDARQKAARQLEGDLKKNLQDLALPQVRLKWELQASALPEEFSSTGADRLTLWISFNPGEAMRPFQEIISGGELSRLLLALYELVYPGEQYGTLIFDEVDAGVGGAVAELIGRKLAAVGKQTQVLCVTHLPQIASQARWHYKVEKQVKKGRTFSSVRLLSPEERVQEVARMLGGVRVSEQALDHARELLKGSAA